MRYLKRVLLICLFISMLSACQTASVMSENAVGEHDRVETNNPAVKSLLDQARSDRVRFYLEEATAKLERALRIEPINPYLWFELAQVKADSQESHQAKNLALKARSYASGNLGLQSQIDDFISNL